MTTTKQSSSRRRFLRAAGTSAAGVLLAGMPKGFTGGVYAADGPETTAMRFGIIALTDCAPIVMAHELGLFKKFGIDSVVSKEAYPVNHPTSQPFVRTACSSTPRCSRTDSSGRC